MTQPEFRDFTEDDYDVFQGVEEDDHPRIAEIEGKLDDAEVTFVIIVTRGSIYIPVYPRVVNDVDSDIVCEFLRTTSFPQKNECYKGVSYAMLFDWDNIISQHMENVGFERINYKE